MRMRSASRSSRLPRTGCKDTEALRRQLRAVAPLLATNAFLWIVRAGDVAQHAATIADLADPVNLVVAGTCRFDDQWSGVKLTAR
jgi:hypothetical protein